MILITWFFLFIINVAKIIMIINKFASSQLNGFFLALETLRYWLWAVRSFYILTVYNNNTIILFVDNSIGWESCTSPSSEEHGDDDETEPEVSRYRAETLSQHGGRTLHQRNRKSAAIVQRHSHNMKCKPCISGTRSQPLSCRDTLTTWSANPASAEPEVSRYRAETLSQPPCGAGLE